MANVGETLMTDDERAILDPGVIPKTCNTVGRDQKFTMLPKFIPGSRTSVFYSRLVGLPEIAHSLNYCTSQKDVEIYLYIF
jgi:hypothetical protein